MIPVFDYCKKNGVLICVVILAACLRFPGFLYGLPDYPDADEPVIIQLSVAVLHGELNPHWFLHPSLYIYLNAFVIACVQIAYHGLHALGFFSSDNTPYWLFFAACRAFNILLSLLAIILVYHSATLLQTKKAGLFAACIMAILPLHTAHTVRVVPNILTLTTVAGTIFFSLKYLYAEKGVRWLYAAAIFSGLALGAKYMIVAPVPWLLAKMIRDRREGSAFFSMPLFVAIASALGAFVVSTPFSVLAFRQFIAFGPFTQSAIYAQGPAEFPALTYSLLLFGSDAGATPVILILCIFGCIVGLRRSREGLLVVLSAPLLWFFICCFYKLVVLRQIIILSIPISISAGMLLDSIPGFRLRLLIIILMCIHPLRSNFKYIIDHKKPDIRYPAADWINKNLEPGASIALEEYTPRCDRNKFTCSYIGICGLAFMTPDSIRKNGYDYVLAAGHERFDEQPELYAEQIDNYNRHIQEFETVKIFELQGKYRGERIRVFKVK